MFNKWTKQALASLMAANIFLNPIHSLVSAESLPEPGDFSEPVEVQLSGSFTKGEIEDDNYVQKRLEEMFNIKIENLKVNTQDRDEVATLLASGDVPNTFAFFETFISPQKLFDDGLTRSIPRDMIEKYAPNYAKMLDEVDGGLGWKMNLHPEKEDEYIALSGYQGHTSGMIWAPTLRLDWMEKLGLDIPEDIEPLGDENGLDRVFITKEAYTLEQLEDILTAFATQDPDGNGEDDTYGMLGHNTNLEWIQTIMGAYGAPVGAHDSYNILDNDQLVDVVISSQYKQGLECLSQWFEKGLIDPEFSTMDVKASWDKYKEGKVGYVPAQRSYLAKEEWTLGRAPMNLIDADPEAKLLVTPPEIGPDGLQGEKSEMPVTQLFETMQISADTTDEQLARILQVFDYVTYDENAYWTTYGEPGKHSDWEGEEGNSALIVRDEYPATEGNMGFWAYNLRSYPGKRLVWLTAGKTFELMKKYFNTSEANEMLIRPYKFDLFNETNFASLQEEYKESLKTMSDEFFTNALTGKVSLEDEWDQYVQDWLDNGGQDILNELDKAPVVDELLGK